MNKVVHQLRTAREAKGMELKEVEEITKIRTKYPASIGRWGLRRSSRRGLHGRVFAFLCSFP